MPVHSILMISSSTDNVIFSKYFNDIDGKDGRNSLWENRLSKHVHPYIFSRSNELFALSIDDIYIVLQAYGDFNIIICGKDDVDECILSEVIETVKGLLALLLDGNLNDTSLLTTEIYGKFIMCLEELMSQGILECQDAETANRLMKLKN